MQAQHSMIRLAALARCIRRSSVVNNMSAPVSRSFLYQAVARISGLVRRLWAGLVVDEVPGGNHGSVAERRPIITLPDV